MGTRSTAQQHSNMPLKRRRNAGPAHSKEQLGREMRQSRLALFIQQFEKEGLEAAAAQKCQVSRPLLSPKIPSVFVLFCFVFLAQERMNELEAKMENMLATVDKVFKVELMKMPPSLQSTLIGHLMSGEPPLFMN